MTRPAERLFEAHDVAHFCGVDVATIYTWVKKGEIEHFRTPGGRMRFHGDAILDFLRRHHFPIAQELLASRLRVVVIDDDAEWRKRTLEVLSKTFEVRAFADVCDGLFAIGDGKPDAVILDGRAPAFDTIRCIKSLRSGARLRHTRVIVFSAREDERQSFLDAGAAAFVPKPQVEALHRVTHQLIG